MANSGPFSCIIKLPAIDLQDVAAARKMMIDVINDSAFESMLGNLKVSADYGKTGPAPRGGEFEGGCKVERDRWSCEGKVRWSF